MKKETADSICSALATKGAEFDRLEDYSGRGMFGKTTVGIVVGDIGTFIGAVAYATVDLAYDVADAGDSDDGRREVEAEAALTAFIEDVRGVSFDQMGNSDVVVY